MAKKLNYSEQFFFYFLAIRVFKCVDCLANVSVMCVGIETLAGPQNFDVSTNFNATPRTLCRSYVDETVVVSQSMLL